MVELKPGARFRSVVCSTEVIVVRGVGNVELGCGGAPMVPARSDARVGSPAPDPAPGTLLGKRYLGPDQSVEVLCTRAGDGSLTLDGVCLVVKEVRPLPASGREIPAVRSATLEGPGQRARLEPRGH